MFLTSILILYLDSNQISCRANLLLVPKHTCFGLRTLAQITSARQGKVTVYNQSYRNRTVRYHTTAGRRVLVSDLLYRFQWFLVSNCLLKETVLQIPNLLILYPIFRADYSALFLHSLCTMYIGLRLGKATVAR